MKSKPSQAKTRNLQQSRTEILNASFFEIFSKGFQGVSIDDIIKKTSLTKGAFYHQFPTKLDLGYALVDEVIKPMIIERWITPLEAFENPLDGILKQLQKNIGDIPLEHLKLGCPLNNLVQEMAPIDREFKKHLQIALNLWVDELQRHLKRGKKSGYLKSDVSPREVAQFVVMAHEGFYGIIKGMDDPTLFKSIFKTIRGYFKMISQ